MFFLPKMSMVSMVVALLLSSCCCIYGDPAGGGSESSGDDCGVLCFDTSAGADIVYSVVIVVLLFTQSRGRVSACSIIFPVQIVLFSLVDEVRLKTNFYDIVESSDCVDHIIGFAIGLAALAATKGIGTGVLIMTMT